METTKSSQSTEFKCPNCSGNVTFDSSSQMIVCPYCDSEFDVEALESYTRVKESVESTPKWNEYDKDSGSGDWNEEEKSQVRQYVCQSCGGEVITDATTTATNCPYCDNAIVLSGQMEDSYRPDLVIPFQIDKTAAIDALAAHLSDKKFLPDAFKDRNHLKEIIGVYVPFWLYNCTADGNISYRATRSTRWSDANNNYVRTHHYQLIRKGEADFIKIPADGSKKMADDMMEAIEPFDYTKAVEFKTPYLAGYVAEKYDVLSDENLPRVNERINSSLISLSEETARGYESCFLDHKNISLSKCDIEYALLPVWILNTRYDGKLYTFAMNGQSGKFVGDLPIDKSKYWKYFFKVFGICGIIGSIAGMFLL